VSVSVPLVPLEDVLRFLGGGVCHQLPGHSLQVAGTSLPLCARCTGTYLGAFIGLVTVLLRRRARASLLPREPVLVAFGLFFLVWAVDGLNSYLTLFPVLPHVYEPTNAGRLVTGALEGLALSLIVWPVAAYTLWREPRAERVVSARELALMAAVALGLVALLATGWPALLHVAALASSLGLLGLFAVLNALILAVVLHREGRIDTRRQAVLHFGWAFLLGTGELALLGLVRHWFLPF
jgi:uncharacterized membrane protein